MGGLQWEGSDGGRPMEGSVEGLPWRGPVEWVPWRGPQQGREDRMPRGAEGLRRRPRGGSSGSLQAFCGDSPLDPSRRLGAQTGRATLGPTQAPPAPSGGVHREGVSRRRSPRRRCSPPVVDQRDSVPSALALIAIVVSNDLAVVGAVAEDTPQVPRRHRRRGRVDGWRRRRRRNDIEGGCSRDAARKRDILVVAHPVGLIPPVSP